MHTVYRFKRVKRIFIKNVISAIVHEMNKIEQKLQYLADLDEGSAHVMMEAGFEFERMKLFEAASALQEYLESRID